MANSSKLEHSSMFGFTEHMTLVSYAVILLSTEFYDKKVIPNMDNKPEIIIHYNDIKSVVDSGDGEYSCVRITRRCPFRIFMELLDIAALNSYIIWRIKNPDLEKNNPGKRRMFLQNLILELSTPCVEGRAQNPSRLHKHVLDAMETVGVTINNRSENKLDGQSSKLSSGRRCAYCTRTQDRKTRFMCVLCKKLVYANHRRENIIAKCIDCAK